MRKIFYNTPDERAQYITEAENNDEVLIEEGNIFDTEAKVEEGQEPPKLSYLVFGELMLIIPQLPTLEERVKALEDAQLASMGL